MSEPSVSRPAEVMRGLLFGVIGLVCLAIVAYEVVDRVQFLRNARVADGQVESLNAGGSHPQVAFTTDGGQRISYPQNGLIFGYQQGQSVRVLYLPERAQASAIVDDFGALWGMTALLGLLGAAFAGVGLHSLLKRR
ncbi:DUF3592 domain-containing protein [Pseudomonas nitroreducens]|uniref:DUF3592 domain-containing protein n=1 Tax=Pseudomonas nitroreducens TaxID=46680 RepID=A0A246F9W4_PSENT|nr:DUF3592 domain-containing protein [Pseudomonas nitroreducens]OWP51089.1 hypothetical protein CEG18_09455 [Pseudomonas nitroreducens]